MSGYLDIHVHIAVDKIMQHCLSPEELNIVVCIYACIANMSLPGDPSKCSDPKLRNEKAMLAHVCRLTTRKFGIHWPKVMDFFEVNEDHVRLSNWHWVTYAVHSTRKRAAIPTDAKNAAAQRFGRLCAYCGDADGPFEYDHLYPVSKGGTDDASNIVLACKPCNREKSSLTLLEWMDMRAAYV